MLMHKHVYTFSDICTIRHIVIDSIMHSLIYFPCPLSLFLLSLSLFLSRSVTCMRSYICLYTLSHIFTIIYKCTDAIMLLLSAIHTRAHTLIPKRAHTHAHHRHAHRQDIHSHTLLLHITDTTKNKLIYEIHFLFYCHTNLISKEFSRIFYVLLVCKAITFHQHCKILCTIIVIFNYI